MKQQILYLFLGVFVLGCKTAKVMPPPPEPVILTIGGHKIMTDDFFQSFTKNQFSEDTTKPTSIDKYLELYTGFKLKVIDAQSRGLDSSAGFKEELATYKKQLAQPYLSDKVLIDHLVAEAYERSKEEVRASHILVPVALFASPADTLSAYRAALAMKGRLEEGESFADLAKRFSKDTVSASKGGDLDYFSVFQKTYPIETAAYKTAIGKIAGPVRSAAGYHLIYVTDRRPSRAKLQVAHILVSMSNSASSEGQKVAQARIEEVYERIRQGEAFENVCRAYSDDRTTKLNGGVLASFGTGTLVTPFEDAAYALTNVGDVSKPFKTNYGWHVIKLLKKLPVASFSEVAPAFKLKVTTDSRGVLVRQQLISKLRKEYKVEEDEVSNAIAQVDTMLLKGKWKQPKPSALDKKTLFEIDKQPFEIGQFYVFLQKNQEPQPKGTSLKTLALHYVKQFEDKSLIEYEENNLEKKYPDFRALIGEVRDGMLLSQMMEENVWSKSMTDTTAQRALYEQTKQNYRYPERAVATIITTDSDSLLKRASQSLSKKPYQLKLKSVDFLYEPNEKTLTQKHREDLFEVVATMINKEHYEVEVSGYCDPQEADSLSRQRINYVVKALTNNGVPLARIMEKDYQKFNPVANPLRNRRVSFQFFSNSKKDIEKSLKALHLGNIEIVEGVFSKGQNPYIDKAKWAVGSQTLNDGNKKIAVNIEKIEPSRIKTFAEARGAVINKYQRILEKEYLEKLKVKFPVIKNDTEINKLVIGR